MQNLSSRDMDITLLEDRLESRQPFYTYVDGNTAYVSATRVGARFASSVAEFDPENTVPLTNRVLPIYFFPLTRPVNRVKWVASGK